MKEEDGVVRIVQLLTLDVSPKSKERPRSVLGRCRPYMSKAYKQWLKDARWAIKQQWAHGLVRNVHLRLEFHGAERGDLDNLAGSVMDACTGIIWPDDSVRYIQQLTCRWVRAKKADHMILVTINAEMS